MVTIPSDKLGMESGWNTVRSTVQETPPNELPRELEIESKEHYGTMNIRPYFSKLAVEQEKLRDGKILMKNQEVRTLRNQISTITDFLDHANYELKNTHGDQIHMTKHSALLEELKKIVPEHAAKLIGDRSIFNRREVEMMCQMFTRKIDSDLVPKIDELKDDILDIMQLLDKILPLLKELVKKYDDHITYITRQAR